MGFDGADRAEKLYAAWRAACVVPDAWEAWRDYRRQVTDYVLENSLPGTKLAIFGAGRCNDFDLVRLLGHFSQVTLLDVDEGAVKEAAGRCGISGKEPRLALFPVDFVGICPADYIGFADALIRRLWCGEAEYAHAGDGRQGGDGGRVPAPLSLLQAMYAKSRNHTPALPEEPFDYTIALGVHSQLGNLPAWLLHAVQAGMREEKVAGWQQERERLFGRIRQETTFLSERLNIWILSLTKTKAFLGCEQGLAVFSSGEWYAVPDSAVAGAWEATRHVERLAAAGHVRFENYLDIVWPFYMAQGKAYRMMVMEVEKRTSSGTVLPRPG